MSDWPWRQADIDVSGSTPGACLARSHISPVH